MNKRLIVLLLVMGCLLCAFVWTRPSPTDPHDQMVALLEQVKERTPLENKFLGNADWLHLSEQLARSASEGETINLLWERAPIALRLGDTSAALSDLLAVKDLIGNMKSKLSPQEFREFETELYYNLAIASLRQGEAENCVFCQTGESCILPIRTGGLHKHQAGSSQAIQYLQQVLDRNPLHLSARWLLNIAHMTLGSYPEGVSPDLLIDPAKFSSQVPFPRFNNVATEVGLDTFGLAGGNAVDDFDGDGLLDVIVSDWNSSAELKYFMNCGDGTFKDRSHEAGFEGIFGGLNLRHADYDNDGDLDILVLRGGWMDPDALCVNSLLKNDGRGVFRDVTFLVGLATTHHQTQTADWADFDNDGWLDLYIGNENDPNQLFKNDGHGQFVDIAQQAGVQNFAYTKGVSWGDYDQDNYPDLYVSNLGTSNRLYHNNQNGTFTDVAERCGVTEPQQSFPVWFWDFNNDGSLDIFVGGYDLEHGIESFVADFLELPHSADVDHLYQGDGTGRFMNVAQEKQIAKVTLPMGSNFGDVDGDGFLDYYLGTGYTAYDALLPNRLFHNHAGKEFHDVTMASGLGHLQKGHGVSIADMDNDGDNDVLIVMGGAFPGDGFRNALFKNPGFGNHCITLKLVGSRTNRCAIGARIKLVVSNHGEQQVIYRWISSGGSFGGNPFTQQIGIGQADKVDLIEITWPTSNTTQLFHNLDVSSRIEVTEGNNEIRTLK